MRFTTTLLAPVLLVTAVTAQDGLSSLLSQASAAESSATVKISSLLANPTYSSIYESVISHYSSNLASLTSAIGTNTNFASFTSSLGAEASSLVHSATGAGATGSSSTSGNGVDRVALPAAGVVGAAVLGLAALL